MKNWSETFDRAIAAAIEQDDMLDARRAARADTAAACVALFDYEEQCDQCGHRTRRLHVSGPRSYCGRCCPACARPRAAAAGV